MRRVKSSRRTLRVLQFEKLLDLDSLTEIKDSSPRSVYAKGARMDTASSVELNGTKVDNFAAVSQSLLLIEVPDTVRGSIHSVAVYSGYIQPGDKAITKMRFGDHPQLVEGPYRIVQLFIKKLFQTRGRDIWSPEGAGDLKSLTRQGLSDHTENALAGDLETKVMGVSRYIIEIQARNPNTPASERLLYTEVADIQYSHIEQKLGMRLRMRFQDGNTLATTITW